MLRTLLSVVGVVSVAAPIGALIAVAAAGLHARAAVPSSSSTAVCERYTGVPEESGPHAGMVRIAGGRFSMGSDRHYAEEAPAHETVVDAFWIDRHDVTNAQFARFVAATGYVTVAERAAGPNAVAASAVFVMPRGGRAGVWQLVPGADWRRPQGPGSNIAGLENHPVVQVAYEDAQAYARWLGRELPTEEQWEFAARGGLDAQPYVWGDRFTPGGKPMANTWQGAFPFVNTGDDGYAGTSPVGCFPANGYGLYDMAGNVWQWTSTAYMPGHDRSDGLDPGRPDHALQEPGRSPASAKVIKGGSHLCAPNYCMRYRPSARQPADAGMGTSHIGFRTVAPVLPSTASR
jgi:formylglycine-generating enzyme required for sulfatase activity